MFNLSEIIFILILALILIGPKQLPEVARTIARLLNDLRNVRDNVLLELKKSNQTAENQNPTEKKDETKS